MVKLKKGLGGNARSGTQERILGIDPGDDDDDDDDDDDVMLMMMML